MEVFQGTVGGSRTHWRDCLSHLALEHLRVFQAKMEAAARGVDIWKTLMYLTSDQRKTTVGWICIRRVGKEAGKNGRKSMYTDPIGFRGRGAGFLCVRVLIIQNSLY